MHESGHSKTVHWDNPEGWNGEGDGRGVRNGGHMHTHGWLMSMYGKTHHNIVICKSNYNKLIINNIYSNNIIFIMN